MHTAYESPNGTIRLIQLGGNPDHLTLTAHNTNAAVSITLNRAELISIARQLTSEPEWTPAKIDACAAHDFNDES